MNILNILFTCISLNFFNIFLGFSTGRDCYFEHFSLVKKGCATQCCHHRVKTTYSKYAGKNMPLRHSCLLCRWSVSISKHTFSLYSDFSHSFIFDLFLYLLHIFCPVFVRFSASKGEILLCTLCAWEDKSVCLHVSTHNAAWVCLWSGAWGTSCFTSFFWVWRFIRAKSRGAIT